MSRRDRPPPESARFPAACPPPGRGQSSGPCSRVQSPKLPDYFFQVCVCPLFLLRYLFLDEDATTASIQLIIVFIPRSPSICHAERSRRSAKRFSCAVEASLPRFSARALIAPWALMKFPIRPRFDFDV